MQNPMLCVHAFLNATFLKMQENHIYILKGNKASNDRIIRKVLIIEKTEHTIVSQNLDSENKPKYRELIVDFEYDWKVLEDLGLNIPSELHNYMSSQGV